MHPRKTYLLAWRKWSNVFGRWPDICWNIPRSFMPPADSLAVVDYKMGMNASRQGVFVVALQSSVMMYQRCNRCPVCLEESGTWSPDDITSVSVFVDLHAMFVLRTTNVHKSVLKFIGKFNETHPWLGGCFMTLLHLVSPHMFNI